MVELLWNIVWRVLTKLNVLLSYNPTTVLLGIYPKELKTYVPMKTYTWMFIAAVFINAKTWKQPRSWKPIQMMEYHSVLKGNELWSHENTWRILKCI